MEVDSVYHHIKDFDSRTWNFQKKMSKVYPNTLTDFDFSSVKNGIFDNSDEIDAIQSLELNDSGISVGLFKPLIEKNLYSESICFNFHEIENIVNAQNINYFQTNADLLEYLGEIEKIIIMKIKYSRKQSKTSKFHKNILKDMAFNLLEDKLREYSKYTFLLRDVGIACAVFFEKFYQDGGVELLEGEEQVLKYLNDAVSEKISNLGSISFCVKFGEHDNEKNERIATALRILKKHFKRNYSILIDSLKEHFNTKSFPTFLIRVQECKLKRKINQNYLPKFKEIYLRNNFLNSLEYLLLVEKIRDISRGKMKIFDPKILNLEARDILLKIILIISTEVFSRVEDDEYFSFLFKDNIEKYRNALHLALSNEELREYFSVRKNYESGEMKIMNGNSNHQKMKSLDLESSKGFEKINIQDLFADLESCIKNDLQNYLFIILSLCLMFNNYDVINKRIVTTSAREKECLRRVLLAFNAYYQFESLDVWKFNQILDSVIFSQFFTDTYSSNMVKRTHPKVLPHSQDQHFNRTLSGVGDKTKIKIPIDRINLILRTQENINQELREAYFTLLATIPQKQKNNFCKNLCDFFKEFFLPYKDKRTFINLNYTRLIPYDKYNYSSHTCIIIHGFIATNQNLYTQWENFIIDFDIYVDFYFFTWDSKTVLKVLKDIMKFLGGLSLTLLTRNFLNVFGAYRTYQHKNNLFAKTTKISEYAGKILAYVLASKAFFEKRAITIVGFSLGGHVLKHCLKELMLIASYVPEIRDLIQNVVFIGAATSTSNKKMWENAHKIISGRVINCYNQNDEVLQGIFKYITKKDPMGTGPLIVDSQNNGCIENYDFAELNIKHVEYKDYLNWIIKKINLF